MQDISNAWAPLLLFPTVAHRAMASFGLRSLCSSTKPRSLRRIGAVSVPDRKANDHSPEGRSSGQGRAHATNGDAVRPRPLPPAAPAIGALARPACCYDDLAQASVRLGQPVLAFT